MAELFKEDPAEQFKEVPSESIFYEITPEESSILFYFLGLVISEKLTIDELNLLANGLFETAQVMFIIASHRQMLNDALQAQLDKKDEEAAAASAESMKREVTELKQQIRKLQKQIDELKPYK
ncbi:hypothetical protein [Anaerospora sp.]|uniref:hypothetical protein n=1 Tax=Anaerospora sp. TaxID=1960278 RepID=UPI00289E772C|nr:hypothetical protein [Anaerospora sp.]MDF2930543.1 hypothetical protein [Anaerospora sp.]